MPLTCPKPRPRAGNRFAKLPIGLCVARYRRAPARSSFSTASNFPCTDAVSSCRALICFCIDCCDVGELGATPLEELTTDDQAMLIQAFTEVIDEAAKDTVK